MREIIKAMNKAFPGLPKWKKPLFIILYPVLVFLIWLDKYIGGGLSKPMGEK